MAEELRLRWYLDKVRQLQESWFENGSHWALQTSFDVVEWERKGFTTDECEALINSAAYESAKKRAC